MRLAAKTIAWIIDLKESFYSNNEVNHLKAKFVQKCLLRCSMSRCLRFLKRYKKFGQPIQKSQVATLPTSINIAIVHIQDKKSQFPLAGQETDYMPFEEDVKGDNPATTGKNTIFS